MKRHPVLEKILLVLIILNLLFIWGNSILPAAVSSQLSEGLQHLLDLFLHPETANSGMVPNDAILRKIAHASEFACLGFLFAAFRMGCRSRAAEGVVLFGLLAACVDETLQLFSEGRASMLKDVWIDFGGLLVGVLFMALILKFIRRNRR